MKIAKYWVAVVMGTALMAAYGQSGSAAPAMAGDWSGSLAGTLPLVLHVRGDASGALTAKMDSPTQGANGMAVVNVKLSGTTFSFEVPMVKGSYTGTVGADGKSMAGTWTQGQSMPLEWKLTKTAAEAAEEDARLAAEMAKVKPSPIDGDWTGALSAGGATLHLAFHFHAMPDGTIAGTLDSLDQNAMGIPCANVKVDARKVTLEVPAVHGFYTGALSGDGKSLAGTWSQGTPLELDLTRK